ncbi:protease modulator HflC [Paracoccus sp. PS-1]|uniref:protease modulator HflC n=1 Tax=unclassified Paracoccus (in: a-proteobacteria) TaxID=2688777 RepID=UPI0004921880|nr:MULTISPECIES: protease modulator HflC [unclassified Paracoccus (in: a-proteobacteria)]MDQ7262836.1 protease modulator HflC [Paracoccus sp. PS1]RQP05216.1 MAG: protease modulator HflC [Paracoccus sp. BP8]UFM63560.1 protease modulator HflC [Paracoccus sp. MA]
MNRAISLLALPFLVVVAVLVISSLYIVDVREKALVLRFGEVVDVREEPGLGVKVPFLDNVVKYDARILGLPTPPMEVTPLDDRRLVVDAFARWQITDVVQFRRAVGAGGIEFAQRRLEPIVTNAIRQVLGSVPSTTVLSDDRTPLMNRIRDLSRDDARDLGIRVIDVRLTRTDLPEQNLTATYARMRAEREREAADEIARGGEAAQRVRAAADRTVVELTSEARKRAEVVRGEADARRNAIYADAFGRDPEFFAFTRSMTSYERALRGENSSLVIQPQGEFFDYLRNDGADRANPVPVPRPASTPAADEDEAEAESSGAIAPGEAVAPTETNREGEPLGAGAGVTLTPLPESLAAPPQEDPVVPPAPLPAD